MTTAPIVRPARREDVTELVRILTAGSLTPEAEDRSAEDSYWHAVVETRRGGGDVLVADLDGVPVGFCQLIVFPHFQHGGGRCAELESVHVSVQYRGRGVGAALLDAAEALAERQGCYRIQLTSNLVRDDAHCFYRARGYAATHAGFKKTLSGPR